jgi:glycosyltransferase involved in cell wall biosynthesis
MQRTEGLQPGSDPQPANRAAGDRPEVFLMANTLETGGGERQFTVLAEGLGSSTLSIRLGCLRRQGTFADGLNGIREFRPGGSLFGLESQRARLALRRHLKNQGIAVAHSFDFYSNLMLIPAARLAGVPVVMGSHRQLGDLMSWPRFWVQQLVFQFCDRVVCNSRAGADYLRQRAGLPQRKLAVIPNGLPDAAFAETSPALPRRSGVMRVGMIARMNDRAKNHAAFLRVAAKVARKHQDVEFVLVGDGPLRSELEQQARTLGLGGRVIFLGERSDIPAVLASLDVSVLTSVSESLSNVIMESMAAGVPVVAGCVGGNAELVRDGETGFLVPSEDDGGFAAAIGRLLENTELWSALGAKAKSEASARFSLKNVCRQYEELYRSTLAEKGWSQVATRRPDPNS